MAVISNQLNLVVLTIHLQKMSGLDQKLLNYGKSDQPLGSNFELGPTATIFGQSTQILVSLGHLYQTFRGHHFLALRALRAENSEWG